jgi:ParB-like chromosome segregation protein Spo0J
MPRPTRYKIETLLANGVQPFEDVDDEMLSAIASGLEDKKVMTVPVILSADNILLDGHQRLRAMLRNGKVFINANDVRIDRQVTADNALEWAVIYNARRRQISVKEKAKVARRLQSDYGWSQRQIARAFGVSQPAVSQWFADDGEEGPEDVVGLDGKTYPARRRPRRPKLPAAPALPDWVAVAGQLATMLPVHWQEVPAVHHAEARYVLEELSEIIAAQLEMPERPTPFE